MVPDAEAFRALITEQGEPVLWFRGIPCACYRPANNSYTQDCPLHCEHGYLYTQQFKAANGDALAGVDDDGLPTEGARVVIQDKKTELVDANGVFKGFGDAQILAMPDEIPLCRPDIFVPLTRQEQAREVGMRGDDKLKNPYACRIIALVSKAGATLKPGLDYVLNKTTNSVEWRSDAVADGENYSLAYYYRPRFWYLGVMDRAARPSPTGGLIGQIGVLTIKHPDQIYPPS